MNIRGTEPRLNSMMIDGERIPVAGSAPSPGRVDVIPSELLQSIEVSKALTPDMDGDSIGGSVNLVMKHAPEQFHVFGSVGGGYNQMLEYGSEQLQRHGRPPLRQRQVRRDRLGQQFDDPSRQPGHGSRPTRRRSR